MCIHQLVESPGGVGDPKGNVRPELLLFPCMGSRSRPLALDPIAEEMAFHNN